MIDNSIGISIQTLPDGILHIWFYTEVKWTDYQIGRVPVANGIEVSFYDGEEEVREVIPIDHFNMCDYSVTHSQDKDQITVVCIPRRNILKNREKVMCKIGALPFQEK